MRNLDSVFAALSKSPFRRKFKLGKYESEYLQTKGFPLILSHAKAFIAKRLAPAVPYKDGKQTPWRGHPVFIAQHATATCCRGCLQKWHGIQRGRPLTVEEQAHVVEAIERWLRMQVQVREEVNSAMGKAGGLEVRGT